MHTSFNQTGAATGQQALEISIKGVSNSTVTAFASATNPQNSRNSTIGGSEETRTKPSTMKSTAANGTLLRRLMSLKL